MTKKDLEKSTLPKREDTVIANAVRNQSTVKPRDYRKETRGETPANPER